MFTWLFVIGHPGQLPAEDGSGRTHSPGTMPKTIILREVPLQDEQGIATLTTEEGVLAGRAPSLTTRSLEAIERGDYPPGRSSSSHACRQAADYRINPFDVTKVWPYADYP